MIPSSHRLRAEEKRVWHKLIWTILSLCFGLVILVFAGLPLFAKIIATLGSFRRDKPVANETVQEMLLFPPVLDPTFEATNSSRITLTGFGTEESAVKIFVNKQEKAKALVDKEGKFKVSNILLAEGENTIFAKTIKDNKESSPSSLLIVAYLKNPPEISIDNPADNQKFSGDNKEITITGETDASNKVTINERVVIVDQNGNFSFKVVLSEGENSFKIKVTDPAGNQTELEKKVTFTP